MRERYPHVHIVILTLHQDFEYIQEALRLGAIDYIAKVQLEQEKFEEVLGRIAARIRETRLMEKPHEASKASTSKLNEESEKSILEIKNRFRSFEWIHNDLLFHEILEELSSMQLSQTKWIALLVEWVYDWNRVFESDAFARIELPESMLNGEVAQYWLLQIRQHIQSYNRKRNISSEVVSAVMRSVNLMQFEMSGQITTAEIAFQVNMSRSYFSQCFKEIVGINFNEYLRNIRIEKAKAYLIGSSKTIQWIAEHTGYLDERCFSRIFRNQTGSLRSEYRKSLRDGGPK